MSSQKNLEKGSAEYIGICEAKDKVTKKLYREFQDLVRDRLIDKMPTTLASMRVEHARMLVMQFELLRRLADTTKPDIKELVQLSIAATMCTAILSTIDSCETTMNQAVGDVGSRDVPVIEDTNSNSDKPKLSKKPQSEEVPLLLLYRMEGCGACNRFLPAWKSFTEQFNGKNLRTEDIEYYAKKAMCQEANVNEFPTVRLFYIKNGDHKVDTYQGPPSVDGLVKFVSSRVPTFLA